ncbi:MAG: YicC/YloC family endoribonuclease [Nitrospirota bacterium]
MILSMTGFGRASGNTSFGRVSVEIKSVNHRFLDILARLPAGWSSIEAFLREEIGRTIRRGRVEVSINRSEGVRARPLATLDLAAAKRHLGELRKTARALRLPGTVTLSDLLRCPDLFVVPAEDISPEAAWTEVKPIVTKALSSHAKTRKREGESLAADVSARLQELGGLAERIRERAPLVPKAAQGRLEKRVADLARQPVDPARLAQEVAILAERSDITEEVTRLASHLKQASEIGRRSEGVGKAFDFLLQEMNREINTIGSKAGDIEITRSVLTAKQEVEKIREQIQNIE